MVVNGSRESHGRELIVAGRLSTGGRAVGAQALERHFGLFDDEAGIVRRSQARRLSDSAVDIDDETARSAHHMVMVVPDATLVPSHRARRLDAADEPHLGESVERIVDGLVGDRRQRFADGTDYGVGVRMRMVPHGIEHCDPLFRHTQRRLPQSRGTVFVVFMLRPVHSTRMPASFE